MEGILVGGSSAVVAVAVVVVVAPVFAFAFGRETTLGSVVAETGSGALSAVATLCRGREVAFWAAFFVPLVAVGVVAAVAFAVAAMFVLFDTFLPVSCGVF